MFRCVLQIRTTSSRHVDRSFADVKHAASRCETRNRNRWYLNQKCALQALQGLWYKTRRCRESVSGNTCFEVQRHGLTFVLVFLFSKYLTSTTSPGHGFCGFEPGRRQEAVTLFFQRFPLSSKALLNSSHSSAIGSKSRTANSGGWNAITDNEWQLQGTRHPNATRYSQEQLRKESRLGNGFHPARNLY